MNIENQINLIGRLTKATELKTYTNANGTGCILKNTLAVNRKGKDEPANFFDFTAWGKTAEYLSQWSKKGDKIAIFGELNQSVWQDEQGQNRYYISVNVENAKILLTTDNKQQINQLPQNAELQPQPQEPSNEQGKDEIPF